MNSPIHQTFPKEMKTRGVNSMRLKEGDKVASMNIIPFGMRKDFPRASDIPGSRGRYISPPWLLFLSESGYGKRVPLSEFRLSRFRSMGLIGYKEIISRISVYMMGL
ncbi:hypothetical protein KFK09_014876 [Dendrobium nobile]|uniref:Uncharacterized protein n=1 Tax=Dendrobium nobile TaxID=94219 RepID=A0A8T3B3A3_DENNO|nr:hypothetical protein KFK09_014876 [Dendrobium nobile]